MPVKKKILGIGRSIKARATVAKELKLVKKINAAANKTVFMINLESAYLKGNLNRHILDLLTSEIAKSKLAAGEKRARLKLVQDWKNRPYI